MKELTDIEDDSHRLLPTQGDAIVRLPDLKGQVDQFACDPRWAFRNLVR